MQALQGSSETFHVVGQCVVGMSWVSSPAATELENVVMHWSMAWPTSGSTSNLSHVRLAKLIEELVGEVDNRFEVFLHARARRFSRRYAFESIIHLELAT